MKTHPPVVSSTPHFTDVRDIFNKGGCNSQEIPNPKLVKLANRVRYVLRSAIFLSVLSLLLLVIGTVRKETVFDPLGPYEDQTVVNRVAGQEGPAVLVGQNVDVEGRKCSTEEVDVVGSFTWIMEEPQRLVTPGESGQTRRIKGCEDLDFTNSMPWTVIAEAKRQAALGVYQTTWVISGTETPLSPKGQRGQPIVWTTEPFVVVVDSHGKVGA